MVMKLTGGRSDVILMILFPARNDSSNRHCRFDINAPMNRPMSNIGRYFGSHS